MTRLAAILALAFTVSGRAPEPPQASNRPNYSGTWTLIDDRTTPPGRATARSMKIDQSATALTIERVAVAYGGTIAPNGLPTATTAQSATTFSTAYAFDGAEHELPPSMSTGSTVFAASAQDGAPQRAAQPVTMYRATWTTGQLVILTHSTISDGSNAGMLTSVSRLALSLDADGSLIVDTLTVPMLTRANGPKQEPPVSVRSVYKKAP